MRVKVGGTDTPPTQFPFQARRVEPFHPFDLKNFAGYCPCGQRIRKEVAVARYGECLRHLFGCIPGRQPRLAQCGIGDDRVAVGRCESGGRGGCGYRVGIAPASPPGDGGAEAAFRIGVAHFDGNFLAFASEREDFHATPCSEETETFGHVEKRRKFDGCPFGKLLQQRQQLQDVRTAIFR